MKNKIISLFVILMLLLISCNSAFAIQESSADLKDDNMEEVQKDLDEVNQYTNYFFTPYVNELPKEELDLEEDDSLIIPTNSTVLPIPKFRLMLKNIQNWRDEKYGKNKKEVVLKDKEALQVEKSQAILDCDFMEYFAEKRELQADGNVVMTFPENNSSISADRMTYNQGSNIIKAFGNVVLITDGTKLTGDYMQVDLNEENALLDKPITDYLMVHATSKRGYMYGDEIIQEQGEMYISEKTPVDVRAEMFGPDLDTMYVADKNKGYYSKGSHGTKFKIKTKELIINSKKEHDTATLKNAYIYFNDKKIVKIPSITVHTNKKKDYAEADFPELGTITNLGMYAGPGFVFDTPRGTTLKIVPILNYQSNGDDCDDNSFGFGSIVKFKSATNKTDMAYGTANKIFIMRGLQKLGENTYFQYGSNGYMDDWFMGFRMPKLLGEVVYFKRKPMLGFLGEDLPLTFSNRISGAYAQDGSGTAPLLDGEGAIGTMRLKYMNEVAQTLYSFSDQQESSINARIELTAQSSTAVYGTGDTQIIGRIGPRIHTQYKNWMQDAGYFLSAYSDNSPMMFDKYMYGRSNVYVRESFRLCKYFTLSWMGSFNLSQDSWDGKMMQENTFFFAIGPDDIRLNIGYDTIRQQSFVTMTMHLDAKGTKIEYDKMIIKNPDTLGKASEPLPIFSVPANLYDDEDKKKGDKELVEAPPALEKARVINIKEDFNEVL